MDIITPIIVAVLGGSLFGGIALLLRLRPEAGQIVVTAAQGAVVVQAGVIDSLQEENVGLRKRAERQDERIKMQDEVIYRQGMQIARLERELHQLKNEVTGGHGDTDTFFPKRDT